mgnify:CR=1 FL=1
MSAGRCTHNLLENSMFKALGQLFNMVTVAISALTDLMLAGKAMSSKVLDDQLRESNLTLQELKDRL